MAQTRDALYREMFERHPAVKLLIEPESGCIADANGAAVQFYGYPRSTLLGMSINRINMLDERGVEAEMRRAEAEERTHFLFRHRLASGEIRDVAVETAPMRFGEREYLYSIVHDVTERNRHLEQLLAYREIFEHLPVAFYRATPGPEGRFLRFNRATIRLFEADSEEALLDRSIASLYVEPRQRAAFSDEMIARGELLRRELYMRTLRGREICVADTAYRHRGEQGDIVFDGVLEDVTMRKHLERELERRALYDELTGLYNRGQAASLLDHEIQRVERYGRALSAAMFDLDEFKHINDTLGHAAGDTVLRMLGGLIRTQIRESDLPARWGGEEFLLILPATDAAGALRLGEKLRRAVAAASFPGVGQVTMSVGVGEYRTGEGEDAFLQRLDAALYAAKNSGRNRVVGD